MAPDAVSAPQIETQPDYIDSQVFNGEKPGYVFKFDFYGVGYYKDVAAGQPIEVTYETILAAKAEKRAREASSKRNTPQSFGAFSS